jgi:hypothetical protein
VLVSSFVIGCQITGMMVRVMSDAVLIVSNSWSEKD